MTENTIKVILVKPMNAPEVVEIPHTLRDMQGIVGGDIEAVYPFEDPVAIVCNSEGKCNGFPFNRALKDDEGKIYDIVAGNFFICDVSGEDFGSLSDEMIRKYCNVFRYPERFKFSSLGPEAIPLIPPATNKDHDAR